MNEFKEEAYEKRVRTGIRLLISRLYKVHPLKSKYQICEDIIRSAQDHAIELTGIDTLFERSREPPEAHEPESVTYGELEPHETSEAPISAERYGEDWQSEVYYDDG